MVGVFPSGKPSFDPIEGWNGHGLVVPTLAELNLGPFRWETLGQGVLPVKQPGGRLGPRK